MLCCAGDAFAPLDSARFGPLGVSNFAGRFDSRQPAAALPQSARCSSTFDAKEFLDKGKSAGDAEVTFTVGMPSSNFDRIQNLLADRCVVCFCSKHANKQCLACNRKLHLKRVPRSLMLGIARMRALLSFRVLHRQSFPTTPRRLLCSSNPKSPNYAQWLPMEQVRLLELHVVRLLLYCSPYHSL